MVFLMKILLDTLMKIFIMQRHLVAEISRFKFDDCRVIRTEASDLNFLWAVYVESNMGLTKKGTNYSIDVFIGTILLSVRMRRSFASVAS